MRVGLLSGIALLITASVANAQATPPPAGPPPASAQAPAGRPGRGQRAAQQAAANPTVALATVQDMLDGYVLVQAQTGLQLSDAQLAAFLPKMRELQKLRRQHQRAHTQLIMQLNQAAPLPNTPAAARGSAADEATVAARVKAVDDLEAQMVTDERAALAAVDSVLTVYQRARFRVFEENMEREKLRLIAKVMANPGDSTPDPVSVKKGGGRR